MGSGIETEEQAHRPSPSAWVSLLEADPEALTPSERRDAVRALARASARVEASLCRFVGVVDGHQDHTRDGARSAAAWAASATGMPKRRCGWLLAAARVLRELPIIESAWRAGALGTDQVRGLLEVRQHVEAAMARDQAALVAALGGRDAVATRRLLHRWRASALAELDRSPDDPAPDDPRENELAVRESFGGTTTLDATFCPIIGKEVAGLIAGEIDRGHRSGRYHPEDGLTPRQRNADALLQLLRRGAAHQTEAGEPRRAVTILVDLNRLLGLTATSVEELLAWPCETSDGTPIPLAQVLDVMGDATINTVLGFYGLAGRFHVAGEITTARHANAAQRRHLRVRDHGCRWPGCDAPATWCQAHHEPPWEAHHRTCTSGLVLLCRHHHRLRHRQGFRVDLAADGDLRVTRPDGSRLPAVVGGAVLPAELPNGQHPSRE